MLVFALKFADVYACEDPEPFDLEMFAQLDPDIALKKYEIFQKYMYISISVKILKSQQLEQKRYREMSGFVRILQIFGHVKVGSRFKYMVFQS